jgi:CheY-like chemotaxis protein
VRRTTKRVLERSGIEVLTAENGNEALKIYAEHGDRIDLAILDLDMPQLDGEQTLKILRSLDQSLRVLVCSGYLDDEREQELAIHGVHGFLRKPYDADELRYAVRRVLDELAVTEASEV